MQSKLHLILLVSVLLSVTTYGQADTTKKDTTLPQIPVLLAADSLLTGQADSSKQFRQPSDTSTTNINSRIENYTQKLNKANAVLKRGFDTLQISRQLSEFENSLSLIEVFVESKVGVSNQRSLSLSKIMLTQMERRLRQWQETLQKYSDQLMANNQLINTIRSDSLLKSLPSDSLLRMQYYSQINIISAKWVEADTVNKSKLYNITLLQNRVSMSYLTVVDLLDEVKARMLNYSQKIFEPEFEFLFSGNRKGTYDKNIFESLRKTIKGNSRVFFYYSMSNPYVPFVFIIAGLLFYWWIKRTTKKIRNGTDGEMKLGQSYYLHEAPLASAIIFTFTLAPFVYSNPPMLFTELLMLVTLLTILWFGKLKWQEKSMHFWIVAIFLFLFYGFVNLLVTTTLAERYVFFIVTLFAVWFGIRVKQFLKSSDLKIKYIGDSIATLFIILQGISLLANISGRYSLAKICSVTATFGLTQGVVIFVFIEIILEAIYLELESHKNQSGILSYFDFKDLNKKLRSWLIIFGVVLWVIITLRNLNVYDYIYSQAEDFLTRSRTLGSTVFTFWSIVVFAIVMIVATLLSRIVGYIFGNPQGTIQGISKGKIGSGVLLIRLGIYTIGLIIAFVASGIPMDKLTIIIGALGVGIGFGLQNVVNNLVSGVILAFEKPIQIGDVVEIGTRMGVVNEIGIRSSKISTYEGSTVIIPNGDLIAQHIVNWTHENTSRRIEVLVGVAYGSDVNTCQDLIAEVIEGNKQALKYPKPIILLERFGNSSVDFRILFWTGDIGNWVQTKSEVMAAIYKKFEEKGIQIPFPQQDLHIRSIDPEVAKSLQREK